MEPPGSVSSGRHRKASESPAALAFRATAAFIVVGLATVAGVASFQGPTQRPSIAVTTPLPIAPAAPKAPKVADQAGNVAVPIGPRVAAYLDALNREQIPDVDIPTLLLVADSVCARQGEITVPTQTDRVMAAFPGRWNSQQATTIVDWAVKLVCSETPLSDVDVSAKGYPAE